MGFLTSMFKDRSAEGWMKSLGKQNEVEPHLWQYYDKLYDLSPFMKTHPGGEQWLELTKGQDITDYVNSVVGKYYVKDSPTPRKGLFEYKQNTLFVTMRNLVLKQLPTRQSRQATTQMKIIGWLIVVFCLFSFFLFSKYLNIFTCVLYSYSLLLMIAVGHNFSHQNHILKHAFDPSWITYKDWMVSHGLSHHTYPNTKLDLEIVIFHPFIKILQCQKKNESYVKIAQFFIFFFMPLQRILTLILNPSHLKTKPQHLVMLLQPFLISYIGNNPLSTSFYYWYIAEGLNAIMFIFSTFPIHRTIQTWTEGNPQQISKDFGIHILRTTSEHDLGLSTLKSFFIYLGFTDHILHHMFPAVDKSRLVELNPIFLKVLKQKKLQKQLLLMEYPQIIQGYMERLKP